MDNRNNGYGPLLYLLGQMMNSTRQNISPAGHGQPEAEDEPAVITGGENSPAEMESEGVYFAEDETGSRWRREEKVELLAQFCREGYAMAKKHGHFLVGTVEKGSFLAVPGRFLLEEQPAGGVTGFTLWQPLIGGEELYDSLEELDAGGAESVYGYWIARLEPETLKLSEV